MKNLKISSYATLLTFFEIIKQKQKHTNKEQNGGRIWWENKMTYQVGITAHVHTHAGEVRRKTNLSKCIRLN